MDVEVLGVREVAPSYGSRRKDVAVGFGRRVLQHEYREADVKS